MSESIDAVARALWAEAESEGQAARRVADQDANEVRSRVRELARASGVKFRTARMDDAVVVARLDAQLWHDDTATMRRKLTPRSR